MPFEIWAAEENRLRTYLEKKSEFKIECKPEEMQSFFHLPGEDDDPDPPPGILNIEGETASIDIKGILVTQLDLFDRIFGGVTAYSEILRSIELINENDSIQQVDLLMDTPGGHFQGVDNVFLALMSLRENKKLTAINQGLVASGGYYIAAAANEIVSTSQTNETGSIGVMIAGLDFTEMMKNDGVKRVVILSKNAPDKNPGLSTEKGIRLLQERVDQAETFFLDRISKGRGLKLDFIKENFGRGNLLVAESLDDSPDALSVGMIDGIINNQETGGDDPSVSATQKQEKTNMSLSELLAANSDVKAELDRQLDAKYQEGLTVGTTAGEKTVQDRVDQVTTYLKEDSPYLKSKTIMKLIGKVMSGERNIDALEMCVEIFDAEQEKNNSQEAKKKTEKLGETPGQQNEDSTDGIVRTTGDAKAGIEKITSFVT